MNCEELKLQCARCNVLFAPKQANRAKSKFQKFCSISCVHLAKRKRITRDCLICGQTMEVVLAVIARGGGHYCSRACSQKAHTDLPVINWKGAIVERICLSCDRCGKSFYIPPSEARRGRRKYCSRSCQKVPMEHKQCNQCRTTFIVPPWRSQTALFCSPACQAKAHSGEGSSRWKGGGVAGNCLLCGTPFKTQGPSVSGKYCSRSCMAIWRMKHIHNRVSKPEKILGEYLDLKGVSHLKQYPIKEYGVADFYFPHKKLILEVDGTYWHSRPKDIQRDLRKNRVAQKLGLHIIHMSDKKVLQWYRNLTGSTAAGGVSD